MLLTVAACGYLGLALLSYDPHDPGWSKTGTNTSVTNAGGPAGAWLADVFFSLFGVMAFLFPLMLAYQTWCVLRDKRNLRDPLLVAVRTVGLCLVMVAGTGLAVQHAGDMATTLPASSGGILGISVAEAVDSAFGVIGGTLLLVASFLFGLTIFVDLSWISLIEYIGKAVLGTLSLMQRRLVAWQKRRKERREVAEVVHKRRESVKEHTKKLEQRIPPTITALPKPQPPSPRVQKEKQQSLFDMPVTGSLPPVSLLDSPNKSSSKGYSAESLEAMSRLLELKLKDFGIIAEVTEVLPGPVVTRFEIQPAPGVKVSRITNLAKDLARSLAVISVRVVEVIEGKSVVGIEIPNQERDMESLVGTLQSVLEPVLIIGMGIMVMLIVIAILMPIFELNQLIR